MVTTPRFLAVLLAVSMGMRPNSPKKKLIQNVSLVVGSRAATAVWSRGLPSGPTGWKVRARIVGLPATAPAARAGGGVHVPSHHCLNDLENTGTARASGAMVMRRRRMIVVKRFVWTSGW